MVSFSPSALFLVAVVTNGVWSFSPQIKVFHGFQSLVSHHISRKPALQFQRSLSRQNQQGEEKRRSNIGVLTTPPAQQTEEYKTTATRQLTPTNSENRDPTSSTTISLWMARTILLLVAIVWGTNFATVKYLETLCFHPPCNHPPSEFALARFGVAGLASLPFLIGQPSPVILAGLECGLWIAVGYFTQALALSTISSSKAAFICSLTVIVVPLVSFLLYKKPLTASNAISAIIALSGVAVLEGIVNAHQLFAVMPSIATDTDTIQAVVHGTNALPDLIHTTNAVGLVSAPIDASTEAISSLTNMNSIASFISIHKGDLLALGQPIGFGFAFMKIEQYVEQFKDVKNQVLTISAAQCVAVGLLSFLWVLFDYNGHIPNFGYLIEPHRIGAILWTGIVTTVLAIYFEGIALQVASATEAALLFSSEPVWASLFGAWLLHERLNMNAYIGGAIILSACIFSAWSSGAKQKGEQH